MITVIGDLVTDIIVNQYGTNYGTDTDASIRINPGGQANNVAVWITRESADCRLIGRVGDDPFGVHLIENAAKYGIQCAIRKDAVQPTGKIIIIIDKSNGERSMIVDRGANLELTDEDIDPVRNSSMLYLSAYSLFADKPREVVTRAKEMAVRHGIPIAIDPSSTYFLQTYKDLFIRFLEGITFLIPNYEEGKLLTGEDEPLRILKRLKEWVPQPVLKLGEDGCIFELGNKIVEIKPPRVQAVDVTGAGDSFMGTFLAAYQRTGDIGLSAERAVAVSSQVVAQYGSMPPL